MSPNRWHLRLWTFGLLAMLAWIALSLGWSWFLVTRTFKQDIEARIISRTEQLARIAGEDATKSQENASSARRAREAFERENNNRRVFEFSDAVEHRQWHRVVVMGEEILRHLPESSPPPRPGYELEGVLELQADVDAARRIDPQIAYAMIWIKDGEVLAHSKRELRLIHLDSTLWPAIAAGQTVRVGRLTVPDLSKDPHVIEATVPLKLHEKNVAYVSVAYPQEWLDEEFWRTQGPVLLGAVGFTVGGLVILFLAIHFTIARLDRRRREVLQTARARTSLLTERGMLASVLAHEVRSPLTALRFNLHSLRSLVAANGGGGADPDRQLELADRCEREIRRLDGMLNDFLQRTQVIGPVESAAVNTVISEAIEFLRPTLERSNIRISIHLDPTNPLVHVHPDELRQVILNLATNAHEAMPKGKGGGTLALSTVAEGSPPVETVVDPDAATVPATASTADEGTVTILIRDSGTGIPPDLHERIFEPFFSTKPAGSGLGLALVRRVVSGAGGTVSCESVVGDGGGGGGTTFRIVLPRAHPDADRPAGYAHIRREDTSLDFERFPELVIDQQESSEKPEVRSQEPESKNQPQ